MLVSLDMQSNNTNNSGGNSIGYRPPYSPSSVALGIVRGLSSPSRMLVSNTYSVLERDSPVSATSTDDESSSNGNESHYFKSGNSLTAFSQSASQRNGNGIAHESYHHIQHNPSLLSSVGVSHPYRQGGGGVASVGMQRSSHIDSNGNGNGNSNGNGHHHMNDDATNNHDNDSHHDDMRIEPATSLRITTLSPVSSSKDISSITPTPSTINSSSNSNNSSIKRPLSLSSLSSSIPTSSSMSNSSSSSSIAATSSSTASSSVSSLRVINRGPSSYNSGSRSASSSSAFSSLQSRSSSHPSSAPSSSASYRSSNGNNGNGHHRGSGGRLHSSIGMPTHFGSASSLATSTDLPVDPEVARAWPIGGRVQTIAARSSSKRPNGKLNEGTIREIKWEGTRWRIWVTWDGYHSPVVCGPSALKLIAYPDGTPVTRSAPGSGANSSNSNNGNNNGASSSPSYAAGSGSRRGSTTSSNDDHEISARVRARKGSSASNGSTGPIRDSDEKHVPTLGSMTIAPVHTPSIATLRATGWVEGARVRHRQRATRWPKGVIKTMANGANGTIRVQVYWQDGHREKTDACQFYNHDQLVLLDDDDNDNDTNDTIISNTIGENHSNSHSANNSRGHSPIQHRDHRDNYDDMGDSYHDDGNHGHGDGYHGRSYSYGGDSNHSGDGDDDISPVHVPMSSLSMSSLSAPSSMIASSIGVRRVETKTIPPSSIIPTPGPVFRTIDQWAEYKAKVAAAAAKRGAIGPSSTSPHHFQSSNHGNGNNGNNGNGLSMQPSMDAISTISSISNGLSYSSPYGSNTMSMPSILAGLSGPSPIFAPVVSSSSSSSSSNGNQCGLISPVSSSMAMSMSMPLLDRHNSSPMDHHHRSPSPSPPSVSISPPSSSSTSASTSPNGIPSHLLFANMSHHPISDVLARCQCSEYIDAFLAEGFSTVGEASILIHNEKELKEMIPKMHSRLRFKQELQRFVDPSAPPPPSLSLSLPSVSTSSSLSTSSSS